MAICNKTPVAILHEWCVKNGYCEEFNLISQTGTSNDPLFEMSVIAVPGLTATGKGKTKREAKHNAALAILEKLGVQFKAITSGATKIEPAPQTTNPHSERGSLGNAIGQLQEYCATNGLPTPLYELTGDQGEPHDKIFSMKCEVSHRYETGIGRTKKEAKHLAALKMLGELKKNPALCVVNEQQLSQKFQEATTLSPEELEKVSNAYALSRPSCAALLSSSPGLKFSEYHISMKNLLNVIKDKLSKQDFPAPQDTLNELVQQLSLTVQYHEGRTNVAEAGQLPALEDRHVYAVVNTNPTTVQLGRGRSLPEAEVNAALSVLHYWQTFVGFYENLGLGLKITV